MIEFNVKFVNGNKVFYFHNDTMSIEKINEVYYITNVVKNNTYVLNEHDVLFELFKPYIDIVDEQFNKDEKIKKDKLYDMIIKDIHKNFIFENYFNYDDVLSESTIIKFLFGDYEELNNIVWDYSSYGIEGIMNHVYDNFEYDDDVMNDVREHIEERWEYNVDKLIKNSSVKLRITFCTDEDMMDCQREDWQDSITIQKMKEIFGDKFDLNVAEKMKEMVDQFARFTWFNEFSGDDILVLHNNIKDGVIEIRKNWYGCLFNSWEGSGGDIYQNFINENVVIPLNGDGYSIRIELDSSAYGIDETYGLVQRFWECD